MHQQLEIYLRRVKACLKNLPTTEQQQDILEIEQHLQRLIADNRATGLSEEEAVKISLEQFGHPSHVGHAIEQVRFGPKMGLAKGFFVGAALGILLLTSLLVADVIAGGSIKNYTQFLVPIAVGGGVASFVGRRFTRRYLTRPARALPIFRGSSHSLIVGVRFMGVGALRGAVGGVVFGALNAIALSTLPMLRNSYATAPLAHEINVDLPVLTLISGVHGALLFGFLSAMFGFVLGVVDMRKVKRQPA